MNKSFKLTSCAFFITAMFGGSHAYAQGDDEQQVMVLEELIVTGRKKQETQQSTPLSVSAFSAQLLKDFGATSARDIADLTPGLQINGDFGRANERPAIRGISNARAETAQPVGLFIDGVYVRTGVISSQLENIERVEVLKGPQGALYGRSTYGGVINYISKAPGDEFEADLEGTVAEHGQYEVSARFSGPVANGIKATVGGKFYEFDGNYDNDSNQTEGADRVGAESTTAVYANVNIKPNPDSSFEANIRAYYNDDSDGQFAGQLFDSTFNNNVVAGGTACPQTVVSYYCGEVSTRPNVNIITSVNRGTDITPPNLAPFVQPDIAQWDFRAGLDREITRFTGDFSFDLTDNVTFLYQGGFTSEETRVVTNQSYSDVLSSNPFSIPGVSLGNFSSVWVTDDLSERDYWSHEIRLNGTAGERLEWAAGAFIYDEENDTLDRDLDQADLEFDGATTSRETAVFGAVDFQLSQALAVSLEGRYYEEDVTSDIISNGRSGTDLEETFDGLTYRATLEYTFPNESLLYGNFSTGNKAGGFNANVNPNNPAEAALSSFDEELAEQFEIGYKGLLFDGSLRFNLAAYTIDLTDQQLSQVVILNEGTPEQVQVTVVQNVGATDIKGVELDLVYAASENLSLGTALSINDTEITRGTDSTQALVLGNDSLAGFEVPRVSKNSATLFAQYNFGFFGNWSPDLRLDGIYNSSRFGQVQNLQETGDSFRANARLKFSNESTQTDIILWAQNLFDDDTASNIFRYVDPGNFRFFARGSHVVFQPRSRQVGVTVRKQF